MRFFWGFVVASALWASAGFLYVTGRLDGLLSSFEPEEELADAVEPAPEDDTDAAKRKRRRLRRARLARQRRKQGLTGQGTAGDDIGWNSDRGIDMAAGEEQLSGPEIDAGFDSIMGRVRRCLVLIPSDGEVTGKLTFGMRVGSDGRAKAVNLSGPSIVVKSEAGGCLRDAAKAIRFATFDGPDMVFKYPITLE